MYPVLPDGHRRYLACPSCHGSLAFEGAAATCEACGSRFPCEVGVWRFGRRPAASSRTVRRWLAGQRHYERWSRGVPDDLEGQVRERESVREIYTEIYRLSGSVLDVGGHDGRLREYLQPEGVYLVVDPFPECVHAVAARPNLLRAFPSLRAPCPFVEGVAEALPVATATFDVVHMRSVLDHLADAAAALAEARRVLVDGGRLLVGLHVRGGGPGYAAAATSLPARVEATWRSAGWRGTLAAVGRRLALRRGAVEHLWQPAYGELLAALEQAGFTVDWVHWQRGVAVPVAYVLARATERGAAEAVAG